MYKIRKKRSAIETVEQIPDIITRIHTFVQHYDTASQPNYFTVDVVSWKLRRKLKVFEKGEGRLRVWHHNTQNRA